MRCEFVAGQPRNDQNINLRGSGAADEAVFAAYKCQLFLGRAKILFVVCRRVGHWTRWLEGCPCHEAMLVGAATYEARRKILESAGVKGGDVQVDMFLHSLCVFISVCIPVGVAFFISYRVACACASFYPGFFVSPASSCEWGAGMCNISPAGGSNPDGLSICRWRVV